MAGSQLKRLKASLREQGITGPQQSKKQKRKLAQDGRARNEKRLQRGVVLEGIRDQFNPFDIKHAKGPKFEVTSNKTLTGDAAKGIRGRPGQARAAGEERVSFLVPFPVASISNVPVTSASRNSPSRHAAPQQSRRHSGPSIWRERPDHGTRG